MFGADQRRIGRDIRGSSSRHYQQVGEDQLLFAVPVLSVVQYVYIFLSHLVNPKKKKKSKLNARHGGIKQYYNRRRVAS